MATDRTKDIAGGLAVGVALGVAFGIALRNTAVGLALGILLGVVFLLAPRESGPNNQGVLQPSAHLTPTPLPRRATWMWRHV